MPDVQVTLTAAPAAVRGGNPRARAATPPRSPSHGGPPRGPVVPAPPRAPPCPPAPARRALPVLPAADPFPSNNGAQPRTVAAGPSQIPRTIYSRPFMRSAEHAGAKASGARKEQRDRAGGGGAESEDGGRGGRAGKASMDYAALHNGGRQSPPEPAAPDPLPVAGGGLGAPAARRAPRRAAARAPAPRQPARPAAPPLRGAPPGPHAAPAGAPLGALGPGMGMPPGMTPMALGEAARHHAMWMEHLYHSMWHDGYLAARGAAGGLAGYGALGGHPLLGAYGAGLPGHPYGAVPGLGGAYAPAPAPAPPAAAGPASEGEGQDDLELASTLAHLREGGGGGGPARGEPPAPLPGSAQLMPPGFAPGGGAPPAPPAPAPPALSGLGGPGTPPPERAGAAGTSPPSPGGLFVAAEAGGSDVASALAAAAREVLQSEGAESGLPPGAVESFKDLLKRHISSARTDSSRASRDEAGSRSELWGSPLHDLGTRGADGSNTETHSNVVALAMAVQRHRLGQPARPGGSAGDRSGDDADGRDPKRPRVSSVDYTVATLDASPKP